MTGYDETTKSAMTNTSTILVYEKAKGNVRHVHEVITLEGGTPPSEAEAMTRALELAHANAGFFGKKTTAKLSTLVAQEAIDPMAGARRINLKSGALVPANRTKAPTPK